MEKMKEGIFVDASKLPEAKNEFVCWIDVMGTQTIMSTSMKMAANFLFRFHTCVLKSIEVLPEDDRRKISYYPIMDGIYITSTEVGSILTLINKIYMDLSKIFVNEKKVEHRFVIRGAIAYGPIIHGNSVSKQCCRDLYEEKDGYKEKLLLGMPISQCYTSERDAPPFGIYVHESARAFGKLPYRFHSWWNIYEEEEKKHMTKFTKAIVEYFEWCKKHKYSLEMKDEKIEQYKAMCAEYFS